MSLTLTPAQLADAMRELQGAWQQTYCEENGVSNPPSDYGHEPCLIIDGNTFVVTHSNGSILIKGVYSLDLMQEPKAIDWSDTFGADAGKTFPAIYRLEDDILIFCAADNDQERPKEFRAMQGQVLRIHRRVVPN